MENNEFNFQSEDEASRVELLRSTADAIDDELAPMDALWFFEELAVQLPVAHRPRRTGRLASWLGWTPVYQAESMWCGMMVDYVEDRGRFLVLSARPTPPKLAGRVKVRIGLPNVELRTVPATYPGCVAPPASLRRSRDHGESALETNP